MTNNNEKKVGEKKKLIPNDIVRAAYAYLQSVAQAQKIAEVRIEELEPMDKNNFWKVVLSYDAIGEFAFDKKREYKEFKIDAYTGEVIYMKIFSKTK